MLIMNTYPKQILDIHQQIQTYINAGMIVPSIQEMEEALKSVGYYRLRGYCFHLYDNQAKKYKPGTSFTNVLNLYRFDAELSHLLFSFATSIEVALRARLTEALLVHQDALILGDPSVFSDKSLYWKNYGVICAEIARSNDVFIKHNFQRHHGAIPIWAAVEIMSFGTLSKLIKNMNVGPAFAVLAGYYGYKTPKGNRIVPSKDMLTSWIQAVSVLRNMCAHNSRIYNRTFNTAPKLIALDQPAAKPQYTGIYEMILAMKYLRPSDDGWKQFVVDLNALLSKYHGVYELKRMNFPTDWAAHFQL